MIAVIWIVFVGGGFWPTFPQIETEVTARKHCLNGHYADTVWRVSLSTNIGKVEAFKCSDLLGVPEVYICTDCEKP